MQATRPLTTPTSTLASKSTPAQTSSTKPSPAPQIDNFQDANDKAISALTLSKSAHSKEDWDLVVYQWEEAIALMKVVPTSSPNYALAQNKVTEYRHNLVTAMQNASSSTPKVSSTTINSQQGNAPEVLESEVSRPESWTVDDFVAEVKKQDYNFEDAVNLLLESQKTGKLSYTDSETIVNQLISVVHTKIRPCAAAGYLLMNLGSVEKAVEYKNILVIDLFYEMTKKGALDRCGGTSGHFLAIYQSYREVGEYRKAEEVKAAALEYEAFSTSRSS